MSELETALGEQMRQLGAKYGIEGLPDINRLNLQYGRYVSGGVVDDLVVKYNFSSADAAELRIRNAEAALDEKLVPSVKNLRSISDSHRSENGVKASLKVLSQMDSNAFFLRFLDINHLRIPDLIRISKISKFGVNSFLEGIPLRRVLFHRLCSSLEATGEGVETYFMRLLWVQMYCENGLLKDIARQSVSSLEHERLFALLSYWSKNYAFLEKVAGTRIEI